MVDKPVDDTAPSGGATADEPAEYSAVVYVHGMGSQRRYEETSRLVDRIDQYLVNQHRKGTSMGLLSKIKARVEPFREEPPGNDIIGFIRTRYSTAPGQLSTETRFYEAYWAPVMAGTSSPWQVAKWLFSQPLRPLLTLRAPWRERQRLRRASLVSLFEPGRPLPPGAEAGDYDHLIKLYDDFEGLDAHRDYPAGRFADFLAFIGRRFEKRPVTAKRLQALAKHWLAAYRREEIRNILLLTTMALALLLLAGGAVSGMLGLLQWLTGAAWLSGPLEKAGVDLTPNLKMAAGLAASVAGLIGIGGFLTDYLGDVQAWATYEETDAKHAARGKTLDRCMEVLTHVLSDERCKRVTLVAHSLGTSVAHDALLALTRRNRARNPADPIAGPLPLTKIEHFVTMGSPIDKIEYFFESYTSQSHRYKRVVEAYRGDVGTEPFSRNGKPHIHWINYWDEGDIISGALNSPASAEAHRQRVDNIHVASFRFPSPGASHSGYFDHAKVIDGLFRFIYLREGSFRTLAQPAPGKPYDYAGVYEGPGDAFGDRAWLLLAAATTPWLALAALIAGFADAPMIAAACWLIGVAVGGAVGLCWLVSKLRGHRQPI